MIIINILLFEKMLIFLTISQDLIFTLAHRLFLIIDYQPLNSHIIL